MSLSYCIFLSRLTAGIQYVVLGPRQSAMPLVRVFSENDKIFRREKNTLNNERCCGLLIRILSYDVVSAFLLWVKTRNYSLLTGRLICLF